MTTPHSWANVIMMSTSSPLLSRQQPDTGGSDSTNQFLKLLSNPFQSQISQTSFFAALIYSFGVSFLFALLFSLARPRLPETYSPRAKHADARHAPPPVGKGLLSWVGPTIREKELDLIEKLGVDAAIFLRFLHMLRNIFACFTVLGCAVLIPINLGFAAKFGQGGPDLSAIQTLSKLTPTYIFGPPFWAYVAICYIFVGITCFFLWRNYVVITQMRRNYFQTPEYQNSLHSRSLMITHVPSDSRTDEGLVRLMEQSRATEDIPKSAIARNVKDLPELIDDHREAVHSLESHLAKYLRDPNRLPAARPVCSPDKHDRAYTGNQKVDAIEYLTNRIRQLEGNIKEARQSVDRRNPLPYGFVSYKHIPDAHAVAYATRKKGPQGTTVRLASKPIDIIWKNLPISRAVHRTRSFWTNFWVALLTIVYVGPNVFTAVFLADLSHLGAVWPAFQTSLSTHPNLWAIVQGIAAPTIQNAFYLVLPMIFRRLLSRGGDLTKTSRERHVLSKLYAFYVFNNLLVFTVFSAAWQFIAAIINAKHENFIDAVKQAHPVASIAYALCNISPYWITWALLRNLSATIDLLQLWPLISNMIVRRTTSPSPRQLIEMTAPQPFLYAEYYSNYLFVATVGLVFATVQPLVLAATAFYIAIDCWLKKYQLLYVFITRIESGGAFWRTIFNRLVFAQFLFVGVVTLLLWAKGSSNTMLFAMIPLPVLLIVFKVFCSRKFDTQFNYISTQSFSDIEKNMPPELQIHSRNSSGAERVTTRFGHPALYQKLITPMVTARAQQILPQIYRGRIAGDVDGFNDAQSVSGYSDIYMTNMSADQPGKMDMREPKLPFEFVADHNLDFENFKKRSEFREAYGGEGELYGRPDDMYSRPGTPGSMMSGNLMRKDFHGSPEGGHSRTQSGARGGVDDGHSYPRGYHVPLAASGMRGGTSTLDDGDIGTPGEITNTRRGYFDNYDAESIDGRGRLLSQAAGMGRADSPGGASPFVGVTPLAARQSPDRGVGLAGGIRGYFDRGTSGRGQYQYFGEGDGTGFGSGRATPADDEGVRTSYDYFRRGHAQTGSGDSGSRPGSSSAVAARGGASKPGERTRI